MITKDISLLDYIRNSELMKDTTEVDDKKKQQFYDFDSVMEYYSERKEFEIVGIIDKEPNKKKLKSFDELEDIFKIREKRGTHQKKRGMGIQSLTGSVCFNSQSKHYLKKIITKLGINEENTKSRVAMCERIKGRLLELEKYSRTKDGNKMTYMIIPHNHPNYPFPYNLEDRKDFLIDKLNNTIKHNLKIKVDEIKHVGYRIVVADDPVLDDSHEFMKSLGFTKTKTEWVCEMD